MMGEYQIFHNPRCSKSRQTLALLEEKGVHVEVILYLETPPTVKELKAILKKLGMSAFELLRKGEDEAKALGLLEAGVSEEKVLSAMVLHPKLIERPIVIKATKAVLGRPPENVLTLL